MNAKLLDTFNAAAIALQQTARSEEAVFHTFQEQIIALGMRGSISLLDESGKNLAIRAIAIPVSLQQANPILKEVLLKKIMGYTFAWREVEAFARVIHSEQAIYLLDNSAVIRQVLSNKLPAKDILATFKNIPTAIAPLISEGKVSGILNIAGEALRPNTLSIVQAFANHIAIALENARLFTALKKREEEYRLLFEQNLAPIYLTTPEGQVLNCNNAFAQLLGYKSREEVMSCRATEFYFTSADRETFLAKLKQRGAVNGFETRMRRKDGSPVWVLEEATLLRGDGQPARIHGTVIDITERKQSEELLRESEERYSQLVQYAPTGICEIDLLNNRCISANDVMCEYTGYTREEFLSLSPLDLLTEASAQKFLDRRIKMRSGEAVPNTVEYEVKKKGGSKFWVFLNAKYTYNKEGVAAKATVVIHDITERKRAEEALKESEERFRRLFEDSADAILLLEGDRFTDCNRAALKMLRMESKDQLRNTHPADISPMRQTDGQLSTEKAKKMIARAWAENGHRFEWAHIRANGEEFPVEVLLTPMVHQGKKMLHTVWRDITSRKKLEEQLRQSQKMEALGQLAGGVAHDFNNMLTVIQGYSGLLLKELDASSPIHQDILQIQKAAEQTATLTGHLLAFSRQQIMRPVQLNVNEQITAMKVLLSRLLREDIILLTALDEDIPLINADPSQIKQIIMNLCVNAGDAMPNGGKLTIRTNKVFVDKPDLAELESGTYVLISVSDTGAGMDKQTQLRIFEPFFTTKTREKGTGLGLATVYGIVEQSGGHIFVESQPGQGATFKVYLPAAKNFNTSQDADLSPASLPGGKETILLVEDEDIVRKLIARILKDAGYNVLEAANGEQALSLIQNQNAPIHLLLTDMVMPKMNGRELAKKFHLLHPEAKIICMSGYIENEAVRAEITQGCAFLQKPVSHTTILQKIREVLGAAEN